MTKTRIYAVTLNPDVMLPIAALVRASSQAAAVRHVTHKVFDCEVASQDDLVELVQRGVKVEDASESISTGEPQSPGSPDGDTEGTGCAAPVETSRA